MPLPLDKLKAIKTIIVHDKCPDGIASALILQNVLPKAKVIFCQYNTPEHETLAAEPGMIFADFSPSPNRVQDFVAAGAIVLDHHKTAKDIVLAFGKNGVFGDEARDTGVSGAVLAYREVWEYMYQDWESDPNFAEWVEHFAEIAGIRDTWQKKSPAWPTACVQSSALFFVPQEEWLRIGLYGVWQDWGWYEWAGKISYNKHLTHIERVVREGFRYTTIKGTKLLMFQGTKLSSDAAEAPGAEGVDIICGFDVFFEAGQVKYVYSCRSRNGFDVSALAKANGGGGHRAAAGFSIQSPCADPYGRFVTTVEAFESR